MYVHVGDVRIQCKNTQLNNRKETATILVYIAIVVLLLSDLGFLLVHIHLGKNWTGTVNLLEGHTLTTTGPYRLARHPMYVQQLSLCKDFSFIWPELPRFFLFDKCRYTVFFTYNVGVFLITRNWLLFLTLVINWGYAASRIRMEERTMLRAFGMEYVEFMKTRGAFIPFTFLDCGVPISEAVAYIRINDDV